MYKNTLLAAKGGCICTPLTPPKSATALVKGLRRVHMHMDVLKSSTSNNTPLCWQEDL